VFIVVTSQGAAAASLVRPGVMVRDYLLDVGLMECGNSDMTRRGWPARWTQNVSDGKCRELSTRCPHCFRVHNVTRNRSEFANSLRERVRQSVLGK